MDCSLRFEENQPFDFVCCTKSSMKFQTVSIFFLSRAEQTSTGAVQPFSFFGKSLSAERYCVAASSARVRLSPSAFVMTIASAISIIPRFIPCSSSPAPDIIRSRKKSTIDLTTVSDCPTPTVSIMMTSKPAASHKIEVSRVFRATPPRVSPEGEGRIKAFSSVESSSMRVLSPRMLPLERSLLGSIASTASRFPLAVKNFPKLSIKVLFPTPGTPVIPTLTELPECGRHFSIMVWAISKCSGLTLSTNVMARLSTTLSPASIPLTYSSIDNWRFCWRGLVFR